MSSHEWDGFGVWGTSCGASMMPETLVQIVSKLGMSLFRCRFMLPGTVVLSETLGVPCKGLANSVSWML